MGIKYTKLPQTISNGRKIYQYIPFARPSNIYPNWDFWFENIPSGNPDSGSPKLHIRVL
jgi:hypothetical protein